MFLPFHNRTSRFTAGVAHRRCGKTVACINDLIKKAILLDRPQENAPGRFGYIGPQLNQSKDNVWQYLKFYAAPLIRDKNEADLWVELVNGARVRLYGADNPDRIRGAYFDHVIMDEYADMAPSVWGTIVRPMLSDYQGGATFIGTPKGKNAFYDLYSAALEDERWSTFFLPASQTGILPQSELDDARKDMTPEEYEQEFECSFDAAIKGAYYGKEIAQAEREGRIRDVPYEPALPVHTVWDLGMGDSTAIWFFQVSGSEVRVIDHYENHGQGLPHYAATLAAKPYKYAADHVPHDARVRELGTGRTRVETLKALGRLPKLVPDHKIMDGISAGRMLLARCYFDADKCKDGIEALRQYRTDYDEKTRAFKDTPKHDWTSHTADAFRYLAMAYREIVPAPVPPAGRILSVGHGNQATLNDLWNAQPKRRERI